METDYFKLKWDYQFWLILFLFVFQIFNSCTTKATKQEKRVLWFSEPAIYFEEALPLGNGRIGAMVYGGKKQEQILLNEETLWSGKPIDPYMNPEACKNLPAVREALFNEDYQLANQLVKKLQGSFSQSYETPGSIYIDLEGQGDISAYRRELNLRNAISQVQYTEGNTKMLREFFVSFPDQVMAIRLTAKGGDEKLNFSLKMTSELHGSTEVDGQSLMFRGYAPIHVVPSYWKSENPIIYEEGQGMRFCLLSKIVDTDGEVVEQDSLLSLKNASQAVILISVATSYNGYDKDPAAEGKDETALARNYLEKAEQYSYDELKQRHIEDFEKYFNRVSIDLGPSANSELPTPERLKRFTNGEPDNDLTALYFQFGRYLLISSSRPGGIPGNLQGIWNKDVRPIWSGNYTTNINLEMNYWPVEVCNLSELYQPLGDFIEKLAKTGAVTAKTFYDCGGWCCHHNSDIWVMTNPVGDFGKGNPQWANWNMAGVWLSTHLWEHFAFTRDTVYLKEKAYPLMKGAARFCLDYLVPDKDGYLVTAPATSPENNYLTDTGYKGAVLYGATADGAMIRELFHDLVEAGRVLGIDQTFADSLTDVTAKLLPYRIGHKGNLQEWYHDWEDADPTHRHVSHLFGLYPGNSISLTKTPEFAKAVQRSLELRTNNGTGWSRAWKASLWARLKRSDMAYDCLQKLLHHVDVLEFRAAEFDGGGTLPNLLCAHPPFQIDGNFGGIAAIAEMLLQSRDNEIDLLPALPREWPEGNVRGLRARGGYTVDITWKGSQLEKAEIIPDFNGEFQVRIKDRVMTFEGKKGVSIKVY
ncbi:MAG: glycoside hydrolase N-terminal domain-containing protein [Mangrovibacterium sp.]